MTAKELMEKRLALASQIKEIGAKADSWTAEDRANWDKVNADYNEARDAENLAIKAEEDAAAIQARLSEVEQHDKELRNDKRVGLDDVERRASQPDKIIADESRDESLCISAWLSVGERRSLTKDQLDACKRRNVNPHEKEYDFKIASRYSVRPAWSTGNSTGVTESRAGLDTTTSGKGITTIPAGFVYNLEQKLLAFGGPRAVCQVIRTDTGNSLPWPTVNDTTNTGELLAEATSIGSSVDPTFAAVTFAAYKYSSKAVLVSSELLQDSAFDMGSYVGDALGTRLGRITGAQTTTGTGSSQPNGIVTAATAAVTAASTTSIDPDELITLIHSLDPAYRGMSGVGFMMNDNILSHLRKKKDSDGAYLWQPSYQLGVPDRLLGYPVTINQHMASALTTGQKVVLFGDFSKYIIRDVASIRSVRMNERYADTDQVGFVSFLRMDANTIQAVALRLLTLG